MPELRISTAGHNSTKGRRKKAPLPGDVSARASHVPHSHKRFPSEQANGAVSTATHLEPAPIRHGPWPLSGAPTSRLRTSIKGRRKGGGDKSKARRIAVGKWCNTETHTALGCAGTAPLGVRASAQHAERHQRHGRGMVRPRHIRAVKKKGKVALSTQVGSNPRPHDW